MTHADSTHAAFLTHITQIAHWCATRGHGLFSSSLVEEVEAASLSQCLETWPPPESDASDSWSHLEHLSRRIGARRADALPVTSAGDRPSCGRILLFDPRLVLLDQMAAQSAVINDDDVPAWELWVSVLRPQATRLLDAGAPHVEPPVGGVVCWVPESLVDEAQRGVEVTIDSLQWISDLCAPADAAHRLQVLFAR